MTSAQAAHRDLTGARKAAILTVLLGEEVATQIFKHLHDEEIERIAREVAALGPIGPDVGASTLEEFHGMWQAADYLSHGGVDYAQKLLVRSLGPDPARRLLDRVVKSFESTMAFSSLEKADPLQLSKFILAEHPQTIALVLAHLKPSQSALLLSNTPKAETRSVNFSGVLALALVSLRVYCRPARAILPRNPPTPWMMVSSCPRGRS